MPIKVQNTPQKRKQETGFSLQELLTKEINVFGSSFTNKKKELWYDELSVLLKSGINLKNALELVADTQKKEQDSKMMQEMVTHLVAGVSFSEIISTHKAFTKYEYYAIKIGEQTGQLAHIFQELSAFYKRKNLQRSEIISALTYPMIVLLTAFLVVGFMLKYVVPMFVDIFTQNRVSLPPITQFIVNMSMLFKEHGMLLLGVVFAGSVGLFFVVKKTWFKRIWHRFQLKIPIIGGYIRKIYMAQFTQAMALLTISKVPMVSGLELVAQMIGFYPLQDRLKHVRKDIIAGGKLSASFSKHPIFDKKMLALLRVAEETNQTEYIFQKLSEQYNYQVQQQSQLIGNVLNPILTIVVGVIVGVILVAMYLPMFKLSSVLG